MYGYVRALDWFKWILCILSLAGCKVILASSRPRPNICSRVVWSYSEICQKEEGKSKADWCFNHPEKRQRQYCRIWFAIPGWNGQLSERRRKTARCDVKRKLYLLISPSLVHLSRQGRCRNWDCLPFFIFKSHQRSVWRAFCCLPYCPVRYLVSQLACTWTHPAAPRWAWRVLEWSTIARRPGILQEIAHRWWNMMKWPANGWLMGS